MFLFPPIYFLKFLVKSQPQRSYKKDSYKKSVYLKKKKGLCDVGKLKDLNQRAIWRTASTTFVPH